MTQQLNPELIASIKAMWPMVKNIFLHAGISFATVAAACHLIPDNAVMSKEELEGKAEVSPRELLLRKAAIPAMISAGCTIPKTIIQVFQYSRNPGIQPKLLAFSKVLAMTPAFLMAYQIIKRKVEDQEPTLNIREIMKDAPISGKTALTMSTIGMVGGGITNGVMMAQAEEAAKARAGLL